METDPARYFPMTRNKSVALAVWHIAYIAPIAALVCAVASAPALASCEPPDEGPPPGAPPMPTAPPPGVSLGPTAPPPAFLPDAGAAPTATSPAAAPTPPPTSYSSGEYAIGVDPDGYDDSDPSSLTDFRSALDPYGSWSDDPIYGTVWSPSPDAAGPGFSPYVSSGHWAYDSDWVWVSDYPWGWAPFHYGRWVAIEGRGWAWVPGRGYRGAWVTWAIDDGYGVLGWAPMPPEFVWVGGVAIAWHGVDPARYVYCPRGAVFAPAVATKILVGPAAVAVAARMHQFVAVSVGGRGGGPAPERLGYGAGKVPRPEGTGATGVDRAQQFSRRSTGAGAGAGATPPESTAHPAEGEGARPGRERNEPPKPPPHPATEVRHR